LILKVFIKTTPVFFALPHASPSVVFSSHAFCPAHKRHIVPDEKSGSKSRPSAEKQKDTPGKNNPKLY
jgi:hypothetical protein